MSNHGLDNPALVLGRKSKRARCESQKGKLPVVTRDLDRALRSIEPDVGAITPAQQVGHCNSQGMDAQQLFRESRVTRQGSRPSDGVIVVAGMLRVRARTSFSNPPYVFRPRPPCLLKSAHASSFLSWKRCTSSACFCHRSRLCCSAAGLMFASFWRIWTPSSPVALT